jgi:hypothetical protein
LISSGSRIKLQRSIRYELAIAAAILVATSYLSTIVGPAGHQI